MQVYVLSKNGQPLMPTGRCGKVRRLLKEGKAVVVRRCPFTIRLLYDTGSIVQPVSLGIDAGSKVIGVSATTEPTDSAESRVLYEAEVALRTDVVDLLSVRRQNRRTRRNHKTRYRKPRFQNRTHAKHKDWLAPSVEQKVGSHLTVIRKVCEILPVSKIVVEVASFDIQKIRNPDITGTEYQQGDQLGFWNVREYALFRDDHKCQCCKGKSKDKVLNVHHIESRHTGGDAPNNLITLCETCHKGFHNGTVKLPREIKRGTSFRDAAFMGIMRWAVFNRLKAMCPDKEIHLTYGYITKNARIRNNLPKEHYIDARCISGNPSAKPDSTLYYQKKVRCHNRQIHKNTILKGGRRKLNQAPYLVKGFRLYDKVQYQGQECFIFGRRTSGYFDIRLLDGTRVSASVSYKKLTLLQKRTNYLTERRSNFSHS